MESYNYALLLEKLLIVCVGVIEKIKIEWQWASKRCRFKQRFIDIFLASNLVNKQKETFCKQMQKNLYTNIFEIFKSLYGSIEQFFSGLNPNKVTFFKKNFVLH